ncbi:MAG TPA: DegQ family serine endoprotease [bacterium]|nr:DegQ family serine endoprotease [bacterium]
MRKKYLFSVLVIGFLISGLFFFTYQGFSSQKDKNPAGSPNPPLVSPEVISLQNAFVNVAKAVKPCVVQITTEKVVTYRYWDPFGDLEDFFNLPFEDFFKFPRRKPRIFKKKQTGLGSGFIVDKDGYILTNNHVIEGVDKIYVKLFNDDHKYRAKVIGTDPKTDLALIKIDAKRPLPEAKLGDSDKIQVGEWVIAIGNPMGLEETVTVGVVSAKGRSGFGITQYEDFIQTDAAINPGNSGGPLVNIRGEVIGVNTFIIAPYAAQNIGFAIPINLAKRVFIQLKEKRRVIRGYLGVWLQPLTEELANSFGLKNTEGALVVEVIPDTPAEKAGIKEGDVIIEYDGKKVKDVKDLQMKVANTPVGKRVKIGVWRGGRKVTLWVKIGEMPEEVKVAKEEGWRGLKVSDITPELRSKFDIKGSEEGVIIISVEEGSPADEAGLTPGMIIKRIKNYRIKNISDYRKAIKKVRKTETVPLLIKYQGHNRWIALRGE